MNTKAITVAIADDHQVLRDSAASLIDRQADLEVVGQAATGDAMVALCRARGPDVAIVDLSMPFAHEHAPTGGIRTISALREHCPATRVLVLTMHDNQVYLRPSLAAGAAGYVVKQEAGTELLAAIRELAAGRSYVRVTLDGGGGEGLVREPLHAGPHADPREILNPRELRVLELVARGFTNKEVAADVGIAPKSVSTYRRRLRLKLDVDGRAAMVRYALKMGLLKPPT